MAEPAHLNLKQFVKTVDVLCRMTNFADEARVHSIERPREDRLSGSQYRSRAPRKVSHPIANDYETAVVT